MTFHRLLPGLPTAWILSLPAHAGRLALVIGNNAYDDLEALKNTHADGRAYTDAGVTKWASCQFTEPSYVNCAPFPVIATSLSPKAAT